MFFVLALHANFLSLGKPDSACIAENPMNAFSRLILESLCIVAVNVFVLISGWFGIKPKRRKFISFVFQCMFFSLGCYVAKLVFGDSDKSINTILIYLKNGLSCSAYWFVISYVGLYLLSPVLNAFIERSGKHRLGMVVLVFVVFEFVYGWFFNNEFQSGYSFSHFLGLYLLARYLKLYPIKITTLHFCWDLVLYVLLALGGAILSMIDQKHYDYYAYCCPLVYFSSVFLLLAFSKFEMRNSKLINLLASSAFAVYLFHCHDKVLPYYTNFSLALYENNSRGLYWAKIILFLATVFLIAVLIDKIRLLVWEGVERVMERVAEKQKGKL